MEIATYIENHTQISLPLFKHSTKTLTSLNDPIPNYSQLYFSQNVSIPDKIIMSTSQNVEELIEIQPEKTDDSVKCYLMYGYQLKLKDWEEIKKRYPIGGYQVKLYRGNQVTQLSNSIVSAKSYVRGQKNIQQPNKTLIKRDQKSVEPSAYMYLVEVSSQNSNEPTKLIFYLPSCFKKNSSDYPLQCIKARYFNHKMLQILNQYVSLDNSNASCYMDIAHHQFQSIVYSGRAVSFEIFIKLTSKQSDYEVSESFIEKLSQISMTDKHLLDEVDPLDFGEIKKQIRNLYLQQKRIRKGLTIDKLSIVEEIQNILEFLDLKHTYPHKLTYSSINSEMLKKIRNQNIENKASWIKQQNLIMKNLQARLIDLSNTKVKYQQNLIDQEKSNREQIQIVRNQIRTLQSNLRYQQSQKANQLFNQSLRVGTIENHKRLDSQASCTKSLQSANSNTKGSLSCSKKKGSNSDLAKQKQELQEMQKQKILKFEMIKAEFEMQKQFVRRKNQYAKAADDLFNYLTDC